MKRARLLLALVAFLTALAVTPGSLGSVDAKRRLQVAHSFWTGEPQVTERDEAVFGVFGREGKLYAWYGIGQSLAMLPADLVASAIVGVSPRLERIDERRNGSLRSGIVAVLYTSALCVLTVLVAFALLGALGFSEPESVAGTLALLFGTTFLHYTQVCQENGLMLLMTLTGFWGHLEWFRTRRTWPLVLGSAALGFNLLIRLTTGLDLLVVSLFVAALVLWKENSERRSVRTLVRCALVCAPAYVVAIAIDRLYHFHRFGTFTGTYFALYRERLIELYPDLPASFPFSTPFVEGFFGPLVWPDRSLFLFDPIIVVTIVLLVRFRREIAFEVKAFAAAAATLLGAYILFFSTYYDWDGGNPWGDRFLTVPIHLLGMLSLALLARHWSAVRTRAARVALGMWVGASLAVQAASTVFSHNLENMQLAMAGGAHSYVVGMRFANIAGLVARKLAGLGPDPALADLPFNPNYWPFLWSEVFGKGLVVVWALVLIALAAALLLLRRNLSTNAHEATRIEKT